VSWDNDAVEYPALLDPTWMTTGSMASARQGHTATLLSTGKVLVAGGTNGSTALATAELYDRTTGTWAATGSMTGARQWHTAVQLNTSSNPTTSGNVLISGGRNGTTSLNTAQLYSPSAGTWMAAGTLNAAREQHTATLLPSGKVLVTGGVNGTTVLATAATYDPSSSAGTWTATTSPMPGARKAHTATLISTTNTQLNGKILVVGGNDGAASQPTVYLYDPAQLQFSTLTAIPSAREGQTATVLSNARILHAGGRNGTTTLNTAIVFDPATGAGNWLSVGNLTVARQGHSASLLSNGQVLVAGGSNGSTALNSAELYNGPAGWAATTVMPAAVQAHTATALGNSIVLIAGGFNGTTVQSAASLYDVSGGNTCSTGDQCASGNCVSGVCCNTTCTDQCSSCGLAGLVGICSPIANGTTCNDGNACIAGDACQAGTCAPGSAVPVDDNNPCTADACDPVNGVTHTPVAAGTSCSDGNACNGSETCNGSGVCIAGTGPVINDNNPCTADSCDPINGVTHTPVSPGSPCTDGNICTGGGTCDATGTCLPGTIPPVDDGNPCTADACDPVTGVTHTPVAAGTSCSDNNVCNGAETCNATGSCVAGTPPTLDDNNPCTTDSCSPAVGVTHVAVAAGTSCSDGNACNGNEICNATGACTAGTAVVCTASDVCHVPGTCEPSTGACSNPVAPNGTACNDNNACTAGDACQAGTCTPGSAVAIDDGNPCTADACGPSTGVSHTPVAAGTSCADANLCNGNEACNGSGACIAGAAPVIDDNNPCTADACNPSTGVSHTPVAAGTSCADANACNGNEICNATGACTAGTPVVCTASDVCHIAGNCEPTTGACSNPVAPNGTACTDNNACTAGDACQAGACTPGSAIAVDDGNPCTMDSCDLVAGVTHTPAATGTSCADANVCNGSETCNGSGVCIAGTPPTIDDNNPCTTDSCDPVAGIAHTPVAAGSSCSDGNACNGNETCNAAGTCAAGTPPVLDDGNPCTIDTCDPASGAIAHNPAPPGSTCSSNDVCNSGQTCSAQGQCQGGTPANVDDGDPTTIDTCVPGQGVKHRKAAAIDKTVITTTLSANQWLYTGTDPIQTGVAPGTIELRRAAVVHGYVKDRQGQPIPSVAITILNHPEFGATVTHADGRYDMVVNGGGQLTVKYTKSGLLEAQRTVNAPWDDHTWATNAVMIPSDPALTMIDLTSSADFQVAQGSIINDTDGERQTTILFPVDNVATMTLPDGSKQTIPTLHVRATEFTVGDSGPAAMPADLPTTTAYTYAVEINADEAVAAGAKSVKFDKALPLYVNNFLGFSPGTTVPMGSYNRELAQWIPEDSGVVVAVLDNSGGNVQLDIAGTGVPATSDQLAAIGITDAERVQLAGLYTTGQSFWRVQVKHFTSPIDLNWPTTPPSPPPVPPAPPGGPDGGCGSTCCGSGSGSGPGGPTASGSSVLKCGEQVYSETIPVPGTTFNLVYESDRVLGYRKPGTLSIPLIGSEFDKNVLKIYVGVRVGGRDIQLNFMPNPALSQDFNLVGQPGDQRAYEFKPSPYLAYEFNWDGKDLDQRLEVGPQKATVAVGYFYNSPYWSIDRFGNPVETVMSSMYQVLPRQPTLDWWRTETDFNVGPWDARSVGLGGWTLDAHHTYDARTKQVQYGSGGHSPGAASSTTMQRVGGKCNDSSDTGDNVPALNASMSVYWNNISTGPDGSVYISEGSGDSLGSRIRKISPSGIITTIAGGNAPMTPGGSITDSLGDGGLAKNASFTRVSDVAVTNDGSLYVADYYNHRIRRIDPNSIITTIAGNGSEGHTGDGGPATEAAIGEVSGLALGPDGSMFFIAHNDNVVRRITPDGIVHAYAGGGTGNDDEVPATSTALFPESIDVASDGSLYVAGTGAYNTGRLRRVTTDGIIHYVKGIGPGGLQYGVGGYIYPIGVAIGPGDSVYASTSGSGGIYLMKDDKAIPVVGGTDAVVHNCSENDPPRAVSVGNTAIAMSPAGELYFGLQARLMKVSSSYPGLQLGSTGSAFVLPDAANNQIYEFDADGRHLRTRNMTTGANIYAFGYDSTGLLTSITHDNGKQTVIQRDANGVAQAIVGPYGQTTQLTNYDANGYVGAVTDPLGNSSQVVYSTSADSVGLVTTFTNNRGFASTVTYNSDGTVIKDQDSLGGFKSLTLVDKTPTTSDIQLQTALGVSTFYHFEQYPDNGRRDVVTWPDATTTISER